MKRSVKAIIAVLLSLIISFSALICLTFAQEDSDTDYLDYEKLLSQSFDESGNYIKRTDFSKTSLDDNDYLTCEGKNFVNADGETVILRGTNLGGWLIQEQWFCPTENSQGQYDILRTLTDRFGKEKADEIIKTYEDNWITEFDLDVIAALGFNCVRVPFWYRNFQTDDNGTWKRDENNNIDFSRLDWIVDECGKRGMYVVLDLHGAIGFQSGKDHSGLENSSHYFDNTADGRRYRSMTADLWKELAAHFKGNPAIAAYDLLNEPMCDWVPAKHVTLWFAYDGLYDAVRSVDSDRICAMCCIWTYGCLPAPTLFGWKNVTYQIHNYIDSPIVYEGGILQSKILDYNIPTYMGEFKPGQYASWDYVLSKYNKEGFSWSTWSYKGIGGWGDWFIINSTADLKIDIDNDSYETVIEKWSEKLQTKNSFYYDTNVAEIHQKYLGGRIDDDALRYAFLNLLDNIRGIFAYFGIHF